MEYRRKKKLKTVRAYAKLFPKWTHYNLTLELQRNLIIKSILKETAVFGCDCEDNIDEVSSHEVVKQSSGYGESTEYGEMIDIIWKQKGSYTEKLFKDKRTPDSPEKTLHSEIVTPEVWREKSTGRYSAEDSRWLRKPRNPDVETKLRIYWYIDGKASRNQLNKLYEEYDVNDLFFTADFSVDYRKYEIEPDATFYEDNKESKFYQKIFELIHENKYSSREISKLVSNDEFSISHPPIADWIEFNKVK